MSEKPCILIVDDVPINVTLITCIFRKYPYTLLTANSGQEALNIIAENKVDLVLLDIMMPEMTGYEVLDHIRKQESTKDIPVIMLTALNMQEDIDRAMNLGANGYITKPVVMPKLIAMVEEHLKA